MNRISNVFSTEHRSFFLRVIATVRTRACPGGNGRRKPPEEKTMKTKLYRMVGSPTRSILAMGFVFGCGGGRAGETAQDATHASVSTHNLVARYSFEGNATDVSSHGNHGTVFGPTQTHGVLGHAYAFDGVDDYIAIKNLVYDTAGALPRLSVCSWVQTRHRSTSWSSNWSILDFDRSEYFSLYTRGDGKLGFSTSQGGQIHDQVGSSLVNDGTWHFVCAIYDGTDKILYVDGKEDARTVDAHDGNPLGSGETRYGMIGDGSEALTFNGARNHVWFEGKIDELSIYHSALSAQEVNDLLVGRKENKARSTQGLVAQYRFEGSAADSTDHGNHGTVFGPTQIPGPRGHGYAFDGVDDYIAIENLVYDTVGALPSLSVCSWVQTSHRSTSWNSNWSILDFDRSEYFSLYARGDGKLGFSTSQGGQIHDQVGSALVNDGTWHFVCAIYDGSDKILYVDGKEDARAVNVHDGNPLGSGKTRYGMIGDGSEALTFNGARNQVWFEGKLDELSIYHRALSAQEVIELPHDDWSVDLKVIPLEDGATYLVTACNVGTLNGGRPVNVGLWFDRHLAFSCLERAPPEPADKSWLVNLPPPGQCLQIRTSRKFSERGRHTASARIDCDNDTNASNNTAAQGYIVATPDWRIDALKVTVRADRFRYEITACNEGYASRSEVSLWFDADSVTCGRTAGRDVFWDTKLTQPNTCKTFVHYEPIREKQKRRALAAVKCESNEDNTRDNAEFQYYSFVPRPPPSQAVELEANGIKFDIPAGALPSNVRADEITVDVVASGSEQGSLFTLTLGPSGTAFATPIAITVPLGRIGRIPSRNTRYALRHASAWGVDKFEATATAEGLSFQVSHFSTVTVSEALPEGCPGPGHGTISVGSGTVDLSTFDCVVQTPFMAPGEVGTVRLVSPTERSGTATRNLRTEPIPGALYPFASSTCGDGSIAHTKTLDPWEDDIMWRGTQAGIAWVFVEVADFPGGQHWQKWAIQVRYGDSIPNFQCDCVGKVRYDVNAQGFDLPLTTFLARMAKLAYEDEGPLNVEAKNECLTDVRFFEDFATNTQAFAAYDAETDSTIVSFRGTAGLKDILQDAKLILDPAANFGEGRVHRGFSQQTNALIPDIINYLGTFNVGSNILVAGHSLGGADAMLFTAHANRHHFPVAQLHTIGQPRTGNAAFVNSFESSSAQTNYVRVVNNHDIIPAVPPASLSYRHGGYDVYIDNIGNIREGDSGFRAWLHRALDRVPIIDLDELLTDHGSAHYVRLLEDALDREK